MRREIHQNLVKRNGHGGQNGHAMPELPPFAQRPAPHRPEKEFPLETVLADDGSADLSRLHLPAERLVSLYRLMVLNRLLDERMIQLQRQGRIGFYIGSIGEEATVLGAAAAMADQDWIFPCYREHGAALLRGLPLQRFLCDLLGNSGDLMLGHQMPCHEAFAAGRFASISSPIATQIPQAVGAGWAARIKGDDMVPLVYFGEGATSANDFHTGLNFAGVRKVPVVFVCRNNGWAISVPRERQTAAVTFAEKALGYGMRGERVDGNDLLAVYEATRLARARAHAGEGPTLIECVTYRMEGHSTSDDPRAYRAPELVEPWRKKDPILRLKAHLAWRGLLSEADDAALREQAQAEILAAMREAEALPPKPPLESLFQGVYAEPLWQQREQLEELRAAVDADPRAARLREEG
ncbi:thiamine pyrophosphate-dependent dehydrogenase E1 component subunit alpha [Anaeromyxobacter paludicola]|uniref:2-oxoisovalerate dehydrogenase subunit alpha n=1 Tax=Anaeromyxobacter paludicola TaxID=2918171 RepID=A0ABM7X7A7_9BACT|nr:thiamine pyrophosphate-dependent enzyme [Anaeromyxobacter paludicola]BDG07710.1 3-methyl-2-oxobutanoate dehydrogenase [Anaeromyxobacter paludicola]